MKFTVTGARRDTGQVVRGVIEAPDPASARHAAEARGIVVSSVVPSGGAAAAPQHAPQQQPQYAAPPQYAPQPPQQAYEQSYAQAPEGYAPDAGGYVPPMSPSPGTAPAARHGGGMMRRKPILIGAGVLLVAVLGLAAWLIFFRSGDAFGDFARYLPDDTTRVEFVDVARFRDTQVFKDEMGRGDGPSRGKVKFEDQEQFLEVRAPRRSWTVVKVNKEFAPADLITTMGGPPGFPGAGGVKTTTIDGCEVASLGSGGFGNNVVVKLDKYLLAVTDTEENAREVIRIHKANKRPALNENLQKALDAVRGHHLIEARYDPTPAGENDDYAKAEGRTIGGTLKSETVLFFGSDSAAQRAAAEWKTRIAEQSNRASDKAKLFWKDVEVSQSGNRVSVKGSWSYSELKKAADGSPVFSIIPDID